MRVIQTQQQQQLFRTKTNENIFQGHRWELRVHNVDKKQTRKKKKKGRPTFAGFIVVFKFLQVRHVLTGHTWNRLLALPALSPRLLLTIQEKGKPRLPWTPPNPTPTLVQGAEPHTQGSARGLSHTPRAVCGLRKRT